MFIIEPIDRSIWRMTMISTMPVVITAMVDVCTSRIQRLRAVRNEPPKMPSPGRMTPLAMSKPTQMMMSAATMPSMRVSISVAFTKRLTTPRSLKAGLLLLLVADMSPPKGKCERGFYPVFRHCPPSCLRRKKPRHPGGWRGQSVSVCHF